MRDIGLRWFTSVENDQLIVRQSADADVSFSADACDLLMIAARKQDPDTLFSSAVWSLKAIRNWVCTSKI